MAKQRKNITERGVSLVESALLVAVISLASMAAMHSVGHAVINSVGEASMAVDGCSVEDPEGPKNTTVTGGTRGSCNPPTSRFPGL